MLIIPDCLIVSLLADFQIMLVSFLFFFCFCHNYFNVNVNVNVNVKCNAEQILVSIHAKKYALYSLESVCINRESVNCRYFCYHDHLIFKFVFMNCIVRMRILPTVLHIRTTETIIGINKSLLGT